MNEKIEVLKVELSTLNLGFNDVLSVKLIGDDFDVDTMNSLKDHLKSVFPLNKVMVFCMPRESDIEFEIIKTLQPAELDDDDISALAHLAEIDKGQ